jgi:hypothetical protein
VRERRSGLQGGGGTAAVEGRSRAAVAGGRGGENRPGEYFAGRSSLRAAIIVAGPCAVSATVRAP